MKKIIISGIIFIIFGFVLGNLIFSTNIKLFNKIPQKEKYYFIEEGIYSKNTHISNDFDNVADKVIDYDNNKYYVYLGITKDEKIADRLVKLFESKNIKVTKREKRFNSEEFSNNVKQFDLLINESKSDDEVLTIEEVVLANYREIIKKE